MKNLAEIAKLCLPDHPSGPSPSQLPGPSWQSQSSQFYLLGVVRKELFQEAS